jgi:hypothetical protein
MSQEERIASLERENQFLREEIERLRVRLDGPSRDRQSLLPWVIPPYPLPFTPYIVGDFPDTQPIIS